VISGTPTAAGNPSVTVTAKDGTNATGSATVTCTVNAASGNTITVTNPGAQTGAVGTAFSKQIAATDSAAGQTLTFTATGLPAGLAISSSGLISGTPTAAGTSSVTVTAKDGTNATGSATFTFTITGGQTGGHVADPFTGTKPYLNPDYVSEVNAQASADGSAAETRVAQYQTAIWLDSIASITSGNTGSGGHTSLMTQLTNAAAAEQEQFAAGLRELPPTLQSAKITLDKVPPAADATVPLLDDLRPGVHRLVGVSKDLAPLMQDLRPVAHRLRPTVEAAHDLLQYTPGLLDSTHDTLPTISDILRDYQPAASFIRPYAPEIAGWISNWAAAFGSFDSQGHYWPALFAGDGVDLIADQPGRLPGQSLRAEIQPGEAVGQPWTSPDATGSEPR